MTRFRRRQPTLLAFPDGKLGDYLGDRALMTRLTDQVAKQIERLHPDVVVTWGPDGGTGHPDHRIVSNIATQLQRFKTLQRLLPEVERIWNGKVPFVPADPAMRGTDLFR